MPLMRKHRHVGRETTLQKPRYLTLNLRQYRRPHSRVKGRTYRPPLALTFLSLLQRDVDELVETKHDNERSPVDLEQRTILTPKTLPSHKTLPLPVTIVSYHHTAD